MIGLRGNPRLRTTATWLVAMAISLSACSAETGLLDDCTRTIDVSVPRMWNEVTLDAIRRDFPAPTVHARNLFHVSAAMYDSWAAYDDRAAGYFVDTEAGADDAALAAEVAMSYAAYRVLEHRYARAIGASETLAELEDTMADLCLDPDRIETEGDSPIALGNRVAEAVITAGADDGAGEADDYRPPYYVPVNEPLIVKEPGAEMADPNRWQPLAFDVATAQNGIELPTNVQEFVGPHWGFVAGFALPAGGADGLPLDPGPPPMLGVPASDPEFRQAVIEVIEHSSYLDPADEATIDISPAQRGNNPVGTNDGTGHPSNPVTGEPYRPNIVRLGDYGRVIAEFWADGPNSETPPGHWNTLANHVSDQLGEYRIGGTGPELTRLEWDVKLYFALNGATHDAAIAAWGAKGYYDYARPISMIRHMAGLGQSTLPTGPNYHPDGLPLVDGLVEVITEDSAASGERHAHLAGHIGEIAIRSWVGTTEDGSAGGVDWIRGVEWMPYQQPTFVTPAFAGYVSGHSAFSRASAEILAGFTGSEFFPGGLGEWTVPAGELDFEDGPTADVVLQWATYYDAADQAGQSRLFGGIHVAADDLAGRVMGATCGTAALNLALEYFAGAPPS